MKNFIIILFSVAMIFSCSDEDYAELNVDPNNPDSAAPEFLFVSAANSLVDQMESTNVNRNIYRLVSQYWTETTYTDEANYDLNNRDITGNQWTELYRDVLYDLRDARMQLEGNTDSESMNKVACVSILEVYTLQIMVDTFGDIPYTEALLGFDNLTPAYDDDAAIYDAIATKLDAALDMINTADSGFGSSDILYQGDLNAWKMFGNSLKLKLGSRLTEVDPGKADILITEALAGGIFMSNNDNCNLNYLDTPPNTNPLWEDLVQSGRNDFVAANTIIDYMVGLDDPRLPIYFEQNMGPNTYLGGTYGAQSTFGDYTHIGEMLHEPSFRGQLMNYAELQFMLAEAAESSLGGLTPAMAEMYYNQGIEASMEEWGVSSTDIATFMLNPNVAYSTAPGSWKEKIGMQYWLAMYNKGFEGWYVYRKFDAPVMNVAANSMLPVPKRFTYPTSEQTLNGTNYNAAASAIGGDLQQTPVFWDVN